MTTEEKLACMRRALEEIATARIPDIVDCGPPDMSSDAKRYCVGFGHCRGVAIATLSKLDAKDEVNSNQLDLPLLITTSLL